MATAVVVTAAALANPKAFAVAAHALVKAQGSAIENGGKAIDVLKNARGFISEMKAGHARVINLSDKEVLLKASFAPSYCIYLHPRLLYFRN